MRNDINSLPCMEQPRCLISSCTYDKRLSSDADGNILSTENKLSWEEWTLVEDDGGGSTGNIILIKSRSHERFLVCSPEGQLETVDKFNILNHDGNRWRICQSSSDEKADVAVLMSVEYSKYLIMDNKGDVSCVDKKNLDGRSENWSIEFQNGELCFLSLPERDERISCDVAGKLSMSKNWKGWEVWRFIECGDGHVYISSWTHHKKFLCSNESGDVMTTENRRGPWEKWNVELAPQGGTDGVVIKSTVHDRYLRWNGNALITSKTYEDNAHWTTWHIESAHKQTYFISSSSHDKRIGAKKNGVFTTSNRKGWEQWELKFNRNNGLVTIFSKAHGVYLGSNPEGQLSVRANDGNWGMWKIETSPHGGMFIVSVVHGKALACNADGSLYTIDGQRGSWETWILEPVMPPTMTEEQIKAQRKSLIIGGSIAVASIVLAPFAVMGAVTALGFEAGGIASGSIAAGMMSAEAIASGGGIAAGGTVAVLQSVGAAGLGVAGTAASMGAGAAVGGSAVGIALACSGSKGSTESLSSSKKRMNAVDMNRPFCAWRSWLQQR
mmetsp:Transcript_1566/g.2109  ORF Transcript_1566/g.2109 Transcript_1566/m.2109 type:complete len:554 (+) Transcript_1566:114-1775(+)